MPFAYYGAKHALASKYPRPRYPTIVEPFAGAAGYSTLHAATRERVVLNDLNPRVVALHERLKGSRIDDLPCESLPLGVRTHDILIASCNGGAPWHSMPKGGWLTTPRSVSDWPSVRRRIARTIPHMSRWEIRHGDYHDLPDIEAAAWCLARRGQVIVCEQSPAEWLPFWPLARQGNGASNDTARTEVVWCNDFQQERLPW